MSKKNQILFIAPYKMMADMALNVSKQYGIHVRVEIAIMNDAVELAKKSINEGIKIIISRGATAARMRNECKLPVVELYENNLEILRAIQKALRIGKKIALIWYNEISYKEDFLFLSQFGVRFYKYETEDEIQKLVNTAINENADVIIGGAYTVSFAEKLGKKGIIIGSDRISILWTLRQAENILNINKEEEIKRNKIETIIQNVHDGVIAVDKNDNITTFNRMAETIMKLKAENVIGKHAKDVIPNTKLYEVLNGDNQLDQLQDIGTCMISTNRIKMKIENEVAGVVATFQDVTKIQQLEHSIRQKLYSKGYIANYNFDDIIGKSLAKTKNIAKKFAETDETVLILGESGTGKELFAQSVHNASSRRNLPFVAINCAEFSESLFESELFGYEEGSFTGAKKGGKEGLFLLAHKGTIFLDEISEMPFRLQTAILRVIQEKVIRPVGSDKIVPVDVRIIAASNKNLKEMVDKEQFRKDLFYRLNVLTLYIPALRERKDDIPELIKFVSDKSGTPMQFTQKALRLLINYNWPGNVRELINVIKRFRILYDNNLINEDDIKNAMPEIYKTQVKDSDDYEQLGTLEEIIKASINKAMQITHGNQSSAAKMLGVSRTYLWRKLKNM